MLYHRKEKSKVHGKDFYPELEKSEVQIYDGLNYRHWDTGTKQIQSCFYKENKEEAIGIDIMKGENFDSPQKPLAETKIIFGR
jgi:hypothetical protein